jgi:hypothetical protein
VQSVPGQNELPQTFETSAPVIARAEWNELRPRLLRPQELAICERQIGSHGAQHGIRWRSSDVECLGQSIPLDASAPIPSTGTIEAVEVPFDLSRGDQFQSQSWRCPCSLLGAKADGTKATTLVKTVRKVTDENELNRTRVELESPQPDSGHHILTGDIPGSNRRLFRQTLLNANLGRQHDHQSVVVRQGSECVY